MICRVGECTLAGAHLVGRQNKEGRPHIGVVQEDEEEVQGVEGHQQALHTGGISGVSQVVHATL